MREIWTQRHKPHTQRRPLSLPLGRKPLFQEVCHVTFTGALSLPLAKNEIIFFCYHGLSLCKVTCILCTVAGSSIWIALLGMCSLISTTPVWDISPKQTEKTVTHRESIELGDRDNSWHMWRQMLGKWNKDNKVNTQRKKGL